MESQLRVGHICADKLHLFDTMQTKRMVNQSNARRACAAITVELIDQIKSKKRKSMFAFFCASAHCLSIQYNIRQTHFINK